MASMTQKSSALNKLWHGLQGTWQLKRKLHSMNASEPSGTCTGIATFTSRQPAVFLDGDDKLQTASKEMLYSEQGEFEMTSAGSATNLPKFSFSRKYVWRLQDEKSATPEISVWFVKPGSEQIDYLFHKFLVQDVTADKKLDQPSTIVQCSGGHLCVEDYYSSTYTFQLCESSACSSDNFLLACWNMLHEVRGPKKDQIIETEFVPT
ncbi:hypothetical protein PMZ80_004247 [Knufia obscura]|uniref:DUF6314 domain-containing protein n=2 Tax=Knufia TaxID=430999 RepID=A0AAN8IIM2_9EURO|nr:hypothetical protein PMZ80_004247 [Knufia obscura]KAK5949252.1 hypothetical protein OHC33_009793 [Knufia fluminis]